MKKNDCFNCLNCGEGKPAENTGWYNPCKLGINNEGIDDVRQCENYHPNKGFQIGGYYSKIHFEFDIAKDGTNPCMEMIIHSNGEFPTENDNEMIQFHICDFTQLESFVKTWGDYFREKGIID